MDLEHKLHPHTAAIHGDSIELWRSTTKSSISAFIQFVNERHSMNIASYDELWRWSVTAIDMFWACVWTFTNMISSSPYTEVVQNIPMDKIPKWFIGARLNYAENIL